MKYEKIEYKDIMTAVEVIDEHIAISKKSINNLENIEVKPENKINESLYKQYIEMYKKEIEILEKAKHIIR